MNCPSFTYVAPSASNVCRNALAGVGGGAAGSSAYVCAVRTASFVSASSAEKVRVTPLVPVDAAISRISDASVVASSRRFIASSGVGCRGGAEEEEEEENGGAPNGVARDCAARIASAPRGRRRLFDDGVVVVIVFILLRSLSADLVAADGADDDDDDDDDDDARADAAAAAPRARHAWDITLVSASARKRGGRARAGPAARGAECDVIHI